MRRLTMVAFAVLAAGCGGSRVAPLRSGSIALNSEVTGVLARGDARFTDGSVYQAWTFFGTQGQLVQIDVMSSAFDAFCILQGPAGNEIARDDDSGGGLNARVSVALPVTGTYRIIANTYRQNQFGRYHVRLTGATAVAPQVTPMVQPMAVPTAQIGLGQTMTGQLTQASPVNAEGRRYAVFTFSGSAGQPVQIDMVSSELDSYLVLQDQMGNELQRNDDGGGGLNARINFTLTYTGAYRIMAMSFRTAGVMFGTYTLSLQGIMAVQPQVMPMVQPMATSTGVVGTITSGQQASGSLSMADARYDGKPFQAYNFGCAAGQTFQMDVMSSWDNYALVFDPMGNVVARDDDSGEGLNARITYTCLVTGTYRLAVTVYGTETAPGAYTMQVR
jgi:hypothetical protein